MKKQKITSKNFYVYLQKHYAGKLVAISKDETKVYAAESNVEKLMDKLQAKKISPPKVIIAGPIEEYGKIYVYPFSISEENN